MKLQVDPFLQAHLLNGFDIAGARAEGETVQRVNHLVVFREFLLKLRIIDLGILLNGPAPAAPIRRTK